MILDRMILDALTAAVEFTARWWLFLICVPAIGFALWEHVRFCRERNAGKWWF